MTSDNPRIVHLVSRNFLNPSDGGRIKTASIASALAEVGEVHVVDLDRRAYEGVGYPWACPVDLPFGGSAYVYMSIASREQRNVLSRTYVDLAKKSRKWRAGKALDVIAEINPEIIISDDISCAPVIQKSRVKIKVQHVHNIESRLHEARAVATGSAKLARRAAEYRRYEVDLLPELDQVWAVSDHDADFFRDDGCRAVKVIQNVVPMSAFDNAPSVGRRGMALFFGSLRWGPNITAVEELCQMSQRLSGHDFSWKVAGKGASRSLQSQVATGQKVELLGYVPSLVDLARMSSAIVIPINWGGGTKIKTIEAMALAKPIITTSEGAEGLGLRDGEHALIRPLGREFDQAVIDVLSAPERYQDMGLRAQAYALENLSQHAVGRAVREALCGR